MKITLVRAMTRSAVFELLNDSCYRAPAPRIAWRPRMYFTSHAQNVVLHGVKVCNSYSWSIHPTYTENVDILDIRIRNSSASPNTDGIDPESCKNVNIIGDHVHVGDDCIALKSGKVCLRCPLPFLLAYFVRWCYN